MGLLKRTIPSAIAFAMGLLFFLQYFIPHPSSEKASSYLLSWLLVLVGVSLWLGVGSIFHVHFQKCRKQTPGWGYSLVLLFCLYWTSVFGFWFGIDGDTPTIWIFNNMVRPASATMFSVLGFFIASAAFRAFRARSLEATLLLLAAIIIMMGQTPIGYMISKRIPDVAAWILQVPNTGAKRAIIFGVALGGISTSLRIIFGIERSYLGGGKD